MRSLTWSVHLTARQRQLLVGLLTVLSSQLYFSVFAEGFRISFAVILYPVLLITLMRDSHRPTTGAVTTLCVIILRTGIDLIWGTPPVQALLLEYPGGLFYLCYDLLLCLLIRDRRSASLPRLGFVFWLCDLLSNIHGR